jgi:hypothetical protein
MPRSATHHFLHLDLLERGEFAGPSLKVQFTPCVVLLAIITDALRKWCSCLLVYFLEDLASTCIA